MPVLMPAGGGGRGGGGLEGDCRWVRDCSTGRDMEE